jgi:siroheme synthase
VTHRGVSDAVTLATAHAADGSEPDYEALVAAGGTLVLFMGLGRLGLLAHGLVAAGLDPGTPAAVISRGTLPGQRVVTARLDALAEAAEGLPGPALVVVGEVVRLRRLLGRRPLEHAPDAPHGLADPVLVLDEREADEALAARPEARAG